MTLALKRLFFFISSNIAIETQAENPHQHSQDQNIEIIHLYKLHFDPMVEKKFLGRHSRKYSKNFFKTRIEVLLKRPIDQYTQLPPEEQKEIFDIIHSYKDIFTITYGKIPFIIVNTIFYLLLYERNSIFHIGALKNLNIQVHNFLFQLTVWRTTVLIAQNQMIEVIMNFYKIENFGDIMDEKFQTKLKEEVHKKKITLNDKEASIEEINQYYNKEYLIDILKYNPKLKEQLYLDYKKDQKTDFVDEKETKIIDFLYSKWYAVERAKAVLRFCFFFLPFFIFKYQRYPTLLNIYKNNQIVIITIIFYFFLFLYFNLKMDMVWMDLSKILMQAILLNGYWYLKFTRYEIKLNNFSTLIKENNCIFDKTKNCMAYKVTASDNSSENSPERMNSNINSKVIKLIVM